MHWDVFDPSVDDASSPNATSVAGAEVLKAGAPEITLTVPFTGLGTLQVCVRRFGDCRTGITVDFWGFAFTAAVAHKTTIALSAPRTVGARRTIEVSARVRSRAGTPVGRCVIQGVRAKLRDGTCRARVRARSLRGRRLRARFVPDTGWQPSSASRAIRVRSG